ncbi:MAG TPA: DUF4398 domain-containing protein [Gammaproteobacteria bacterium]|nr:DUF4398 domain-containing protein [Gammaproteobacteria bacterium]
MPRPCAAAVPELGGQRHARRALRALARKLQMFSVQTVESKMSFQRTWNVCMPIALAALAIAGCASDRQRTAQRPEEITRASATVDAAEKAGAYEHGNLELTSAQRKLGDAEKALQDGDREQAAWLGEEADLDAQLAMAKARNAEMQNALAQLNESIEALQQQATGGGTQAPGQP